MEIEAFEVHGGHVQAQVVLPNGRHAAFHFCPHECPPPLQAAVEGVCEALSAAIMLDVFECADVAPERPPEPEDLILPCRICDVVDPANVQHNGKTYCREHAPSLP